MPLLITAWTAVKGFVGQNKWIVCLTILLAIAKIAGDSYLHSQPKVEYVQTIRWVEVKDKAVDKHKVRHETYNPDGKLASVVETEDEKLREHSEAAGSTETAYSKTPALLLLPGDHNFAIGPLVGKKLDGSWTDEWTGGIQVWAGPITVGVSEKATLDLEELKKPFVSVSAKVIQFW